MSDVTSNKFRKILTAKRRGSLPHNKTSENSIRETSTSNSYVSQQGNKRGHISSSSDQPSHKRPNQGCSSQSHTCEPSTKISSGLSAKTIPEPSAKTHSKYRTKNLAERRMKNLRRDLEEKRIHEKNRECRVRTKCHYSSETINENARKVNTVRNPVTENKLRNNSHRKLINPFSPLVSSAANSSGNSSTIINDKPSEGILSITAFIEAINRFQNTSSALNDDVLCDSMEWSPIDEETILENINELRKEIDYAKLPNSNNTLYHFDNINTPYSNGVYVVVDTNIFLSQLCILSRLRNTTFNEFGKVTIFVPWMVIQELDFMKDTNKSSLGHSARKAVSYINEQLTSNTSNFRGQTVLEASKLDLSSKNPDDGILFCCLQLVEQNKFVILLSNDTNLRNKSMVHKIKSYSSSEIFTELNSMKFNKSNDAGCQRSVQKIKILLSNMLTHLVEGEMQESYGDIWLKMTKLQPPLTLEEALSCMDKYWRSVFSLSLQKQCKPKIENFITFIELHRHDDNLKSADYNKFVEYALSLCVYLKNGFQKYRSLILDCTLGVQKCA